nr:capsid protein [Botryosphaeria dothidea partitivirus 1-like]
MSGKPTDTNTMHGDSAPASTEAVKSDPPKKGNGGKNKKGNKPSDTGKKKTESSNSKSTPGFSEGTSVLQNYGLSVSGRKERILSPFKADKFFHFVEQSWQKLVSVKPSLPNRFSLAEYRHASALQLYQRIEAVKFDSLGIKPSAPTRIPLPRNLRVFQPIWSVLANIGTVDDDDLRVVYIPDGILPDSDDLDSEHDVEGLLNCTLYDWKSSWEDVLTARKNRPAYQARDGYDGNQTGNETPPTSDKSQIISSIASKKRWKKEAERKVTEGRSVVIDGTLFDYELWEPTADKDGKRLTPPPSVKEINGKYYDQSKRSNKRLKSPQDYAEEIEELFERARGLKKQMTTPRFDVSYQSSSYVVSDGTITADPGAYGARLHWDPQLWLQYEQLVEEVSSVAMFSLSMPVETTGTYAWILPVEKRHGDDATVYARMPKASIPPATWVLSLLLQSSTLPEDLRSTFFTETDGLSNVLGLRQRYINAAVKTPPPIEQYGTY